MGVREVTTSRNGVRIPIAIRALVLLMLALSGCTPLASQPSPLVVTPCGDGSQCVQK